VLFPIRSTEVTVKVKESDCRI